MQNNACLEVSALIVSIIAAIIAIISFIHAIVLRQRTKKESEEQFSFMANLVMYSVNNPEVVQKKLQDYRKSGTWGSKLFDFQMAN